MNQVFFTWIRSDKNKSCFQSSLNQKIRHRYWTTLNYFDISILRKKKKSGCTYLRLLPDPARLRPDLKLWWKGCFVGRTYCMSSKQWPDLKYWIELFYPIEFMWPKIILLCKQIIFNLSIVLVNKWCKPHFLMQIYNMFFSGGSLLPGHTVPVAHC